MTALIQKQNLKTQGVFNPVRLLQNQLENLEIKQEKTAQRIVKLVPSQCPFARDVKIFERVILRIPPLCKLNPFYEQLIGLRFRALCFLTDQCGKDITPYCS